MTGAGAASLAMSGPAPAPVVRGPARSDSAAPPADAASAGAPARDDAAAAIEHADAERIARPDEHREDTTEAPAQSFAQLLAQAPPAPPPAPAPTPTADASDTGTTNDANAPGDLLALLDGSWSGTSASGAASVPATLQGAQPPAGVSASATVAAAAGAHATLDAEAAPAGAASALALDVDGAAPSTQAASPALEAAATARDATAATQTGISIEAPTAGIAGSAPLAASRPPTAAPALPPLPMPANPDAGFDDGFGTRLVWMAEQRVGHAEIRLNPEHVGPINVRVQLDGEQVRAEFHSAHAEVRQAIEASLPRLRELLGQHGLQLGQADVGAGQPDRDGDTARSGRGERSGGGGESEAAAHAPAPATVRVRGLIDAYA